MPGILRVGEVGDYRIAVKRRSFSYRRDCRLETATQAEACATKEKRQQEAGGTKQSVT